MDYHAVTVRLLLCVALGLYVLPLRAGEWSGNISLEARLFPSAPVDPRQHGNNLSLAFEPEYYSDWDAGRQSLTFKPFVRLDQHDEERSHADLRELMWIRAAERWELRAGVGKVFWGVTEVQHLVDIINQTDLVENIDGEDKLGQPMLNLAWIFAPGTLDLFVLPRFRERTFPGVEGRLRTQPRVDTDQAVYQSPDRENHVDYAARWSQTLGDWDIGLALFSGTSRDPRLLPGLDSGGAAVLVPHYDLIRQWSLDLQATLGAWLWKLEALHRSGSGPAYFAASGGFEYTLYGIFESAADLGILMEYMYDERGRSAPVFFQDDLFIGGRLTLNDEQSSELLGGIILDRDNDSHALNLEASRRFGDNWKLAIEARSYGNAPPADPAYALRKDDYLQFELFWYF